MPDGVLIRLLIQVVKGYHWWCVLSITRIIFERPWVLAAWGCVTAIVARLSSSFDHFSASTLPTQEGLSDALQQATFEAHLACACGTKFSVKHALSCTKGGFLSIWLNEIEHNSKLVNRDLQWRLHWAQSAAHQWLSTQQLNTRDGDRLHIAAIGFWGCWFERTFSNITPVHKGGDRCLASNYPPNSLLYERFFCSNQAGIV